MLLPAECLEKLNCSLCKRLLSRFPIFVTQDEDDQLLYVCGRCQVPSDDKTYLRVTIYESVMENAQFPCINREHGCMEYLLPKNIEQHELLCQYQIKKCKICEWKGQSFTVLDHYQSKHADLILENHTFQMSIKEDSNSSRLLLHNDAVFSFKRDFVQNLKRIECILTLLFSTRSVKKYYTQLNLIIDDTTISKIFPEIDLINENEPKFSDINIASILNDDSVEATGIINITNNLKEFSSRKQDKEDLSESNCKCNIDMDALCTSIAKFDTLQSSSNQLLNSVYGPCQYGCVSDLKQHYKTCVNKPYNCLFTNEKDQSRNCEEIFKRKDLRKHIRNTHYSGIVRIASDLSLTIEFRNITGKRYCKYLTDYQDKNFILIIQYIEPQLFLWRVEVLEYNINNYTFEIIMFNKDNNSKLSLRASCAELTCNKNYNINDTPCIWLHLDHIKHFIEKNTLSFKISVYENRTKLH